MKYLKRLTLILLTINFCLSKEFFTGYSLNQNLALESIPAKPVQRKAAFGIIAAEFAGGLAGGIGGGIIGGLGGDFITEKFFGTNEYNDKNYIGILLGIYIFGTLGSAGGTYIVGNIFHQNGKFLPTLIGSASGLLVLSPIGTVIGYNLSRSKPAPQRVKAEVIFAEFGGGLIGWASGAFIGGLGGWVVAEKFFGASISYEPDWGTIAIWGLIGGYIFGTLGSAGGTYIVGNAFHQNGKFVPTLAGSASGLLVLSPFGSVIGYNLSRPKMQKQSFLYNNFDLPSFSLRTEKTKENKIIPVLDFRLVNARF